MLNQINTSLGTNTTHKTHAQEHNNTNPEQHSRSQSQRPRMKAQKKPVIIETGDGRRFKNGIELFREDETANDNYTNIKTSKIKSKEKYSVDDDFKDSSRPITQENKQQGSTGKKNKNLNSQLNQNYLDDKNSKQKIKQEKKEKTNKTISIEIKRIDTASVLDQFYSSLKARDRKTVCQLIKEHSDLISKEKVSRELLFQAVFSGKANIAEILIKAGTSLDYQDASGNTPLMMAIKMKKWFLAKVLIENKANIDLANKAGWTALMIAAKKGNEQIMQSLIDANADIHGINTDGEAALHIASRYGHLKIIKLLMSNEVQIDKTSSDGLTALMIASEKGHFEVAQFLLENKASAQTKTKYQATPLHIAAENGHVETVELLIKKLSNINRRMHNGWTPLMLAAKQGHLGVVKALLLRDEDGVDFKEKNGFTPLHIASEFGKVKIVELLLRHRADIYCKSLDNCEPLFMAACNGHAEIVTLLMKSMKQDERGLRWFLFNKGLHVAEKNGHAKAVAAFLMSISDFDPENYDGTWERIAATAEYGFFDQVETLIRKFYSSSPLWSDPDEKVSTSIKKSISKSIRRILRAAVLNGKDSLIEFLYDIALNSHNIKKHCASMIPVAVSNNIPHTALLLTKIYAKLENAISDKISENKQPNKNISDKLIVDQPLFVHLKGNFNKAIPSKQLSLDDLYHIISTIFISAAEDGFSKEQEYLLVNYLHFGYEVPFRVAKAIASATRNTLSIYAIGSKGIKPTTEQLKFTFAESLSSSQGLHDLIRADDSALDTMYADHATIPEIAKTPSKIAIRYGKSLLVSAESVSAQQESELEKLVETLVKKPTTPQVQELLQKSGLHPLIGDLVKKLLPTLPTSIAPRVLLNAINGHINGEEFITELENIQSDTTRHLLFAQLRRLSKACEKKLR